ncbi:hypothetical protein D3C80_1581050 [compost metagenome]|jgi:hypothetical protein
MGKADAFPRLILITGAAKEFEHPFQIMLANATPVVADFDADGTPPGRISTGSQSQRSSRHLVFHRIVEKIAKDLVERDTIRHDCQL